MLKVLYIFSVILAALSVVFLFFNPVNGILFLTLVKPVVDTSFYVVFMGNLNLTRVHGVLIPSIIILYMMTARGDSRLRHMPMKALWLIYGADVFLFSGIVAYSSGLLEAADVFFRHINGLVGFYMFQAFFTADERLKKLFFVMIIAGIFPVVTTLYQIVTGVQWHVLEHSISEGVMRNTGLYYHILTVRYYCYQTLAGMLLYWSMFKRPGMMARLAALALLAGIIVVTYKTYSKAGYLEIILWGLIWFTLRKKFLVLVTIALVFMLVIPFYATEIVDDISRVFHREVAAVSGDDEVGATAFAGRLPGWQARIDQFMDLHPLQQMFGSGVVSTGVHNDYLMMLMHGGIFGLGIYVALFGTLGVLLVRELVRKVDPLGIVAFMLYATFLVETVGLEPSSYPHFQWLVWGMVGLFLRRRQDERLNPPVEKKPPDESVVRETGKAPILQRARR